MGVLYQQQTMYRFIVCLFNDSLGMLIEVLRSSVSELLTF